MNIEWKDNAVCYADGKQWFFNDSVKPNKLVCNMHGTSIETLEGVLSFDDFQLNIPREGDYLRKEELDSEGKYNDAVEVFELFGYKLYPLSQGFTSLAWHTKLAVCDGELINSIDDEIRELTYNQLMTIGNIKRLLDEKGSVKVNDTVCGQPKEDFVKAIERVNELESEGDNYKANQAYDILQSLDYEYDLVEQRWYRKDWV